MISEVQCCTQGGDVGDASLPRALGISFFFQIFLYTIQNYNILGLFGIL